MNRVFTIGYKGREPQPLYAGSSENAAFDAASGATGFDFVEVYVNPQPFSVVTPKKAKPARKKSK